MIGLGSLRRGALWFAAGCLVLLTFSSAKAACPGCCSSHGGISNSCAADGRIYCQDGTISPSCTCTSCNVAPPTPTCTGGRVWNGLACVCPSGQSFAEGSCYTPLPALQCGVERWPVKTGTDALAGVVSLASTTTQIADLRALAAPASLPQAQRISPLELSTFTLDATLTSYSFEDDSDYHLVVADSAGRSMIVEIPHPDCVGANSPFRSAIASARASFDSHLRATTTAKSTNTPVRLTGVGFWDDVHGQLGVAPNGIELHPILEIEFNPIGVLPQTLAAVEYHHAAFDHYFVTSNPVEMQALDTGRFQGWARTGYAFNVLPLNAPGSANVCRFFSTSFDPKSSHFYTPVASECALVKANRDWLYEDIVFAFTLPSVTGSCPSGTAPLYRLYNDGQGAAPNHRYTTSTVARSAMLTSHWIPEGFGALGVIGCVPQ
jgi:hypothetical protein